MNQIIKQFVLTIYEDASVRVTQRNTTPRDKNGHFMGKPRIVGTTKCPVCGTKLDIELEVR